MRPRLDSVVLGLALGCTPELEPILWDRVDIEELREDIANPTGLVDEAAVEELATEVVGSHEARLALAGFLRELLVASDSDSEDDEEPVWVVPQALAGTSVYLLVACPGPASAESLPFSRGSVRIDSPTLTPEVVSTFVLHGQLRLSFSACEIGEWRFDGVARLFRATEPLQIGMVPELAFRRVESVEESGDMLEPVLWTPPERVSALFELDSGETLAFDWIADELRLRGRNGELACRILHESLMCISP